MWKAIDGIAPIFWHVSNRNAQVTELNLKFQAGEQESACWQPKDTLVCM